MIDLEKAKAICEKATPGPWNWDSCGDVWSESVLEESPELEEIYGGKIGKSIGTTPVFRSDPANQEFIAFSRTFVSEAIEEIERLRAIIGVRSESWMTIAEDFATKKDWLENSAAEIDSLRKRLALAEAVCEAFSYVCCEDGVREELLAYNMGVESINQVEAWRSAKEDGG